VFDEADKAVLVLLLREMRLDDEIADHAKEIEPAIGDRQDLLLVFVGGVVVERQKPRPCPARSHECFVELIVPDDRLARRLPAERKDLLAGKADE
jgi:hypothetical protein